MAISIFATQSLKIQTNYRTLAFSDYYNWIWYEWFKSIMFHDIWTLKRSFQFKILLSFSRHIILNWKVSFLSFISWCFNVQFKLYLTYIWQELWSELKFQVKLLIQRLTAFCLELLLNSQRIKENGKWKLIGLINWRNQRVLITWALFNRIGFQTRVKT